MRLSLDELTSIWETQVNENPVQVENVHSILAAAASRFTPQHLDHLFTLISQVHVHVHLGDTWKREEGVIEDEGV